MITPEEYIAEPTNLARFHMMAVLKHCLKADFRQTAYKDAHPSASHYNDLVTGLQRNYRTEGLAELIENNYSPRKRFRHTLGTEGDEVDIENFIEKDPDCFTEDVKILSPSGSITILMDASIPYCDRQATYLKKQHEKLYRLAVECLNTETPLRIISCLFEVIPELKGKGPLRLYCTIKDFSDPIFPAIWGGLSDNQIGNDFCNVIMDYLVGTSEGLNGHPTHYDPTPDFPSDNLVRLEPSPRIIGVPFYDMK